jgi:NAD(P)H-flavin reductase
MSQELLTSYQPAKIISNGLIGENIRHLLVKPQEPLAFRGGQFFLVRLRDPKGDYVERSYSAANYSSGDLIEFVIRIEPLGHMSRIIDTLKPGDSLDIKGPFGRFGFGALPEKFDRLVLIAAGVGISPHRSILQETFQSKDTFPIQLFYGFRTPVDFLFEKEFKTYAESGRLQIIPTISEPSFPGWDGLTGYVTDHFEGTMFEPAEGTHSLICGPPPMVKSTREKLFSMGHERKHVHVEAW